ncbi:MAG TPA: ABC transporter substrate-binding protein [Candidatus Limnocylindrales bacterium]|nr:ABC transporter substrate-binding protein [Candidatus Limnocylindrales bacterium]
MKVRSMLAIAAVAAIAVSACSPSESASPNPSGAASPGASGAAASPGTSPGPSGSPSPTTPLTKVSVRIGPVTNAEFAGYIAAQVLGYYSDQGLDVSLVNTDPATRSYVGTTGPEFTIADVPDVLAAREHGSDLVDIAQVFQRSGTVLLTWKKDGFGSACDLGGKKVGLWAPPADLEITARLKSCLKPLTPGTYTRVDVQHDVAAFLGHSVDAIEATTFDGEAKVLEAINPATNAQYTTDDLAIFGPTNGRPATLHDGIFARAGWLAAGSNRDTAVAFVAASIQGWVYCRDHQDDCVQFVTKANSSLGTTDQRWMLNAINPLIWPSPKGIGIPDPDQWEQTITLALADGLITKRPGADANDQTIVADASDQLSDLDLNGANFQTGVVAVAPGGR